MTAAIPVPVHLVVGLAVVGEAGDRWGGWWIRSRDITGVVLLHGRAVVLSGRRPDQHNSTTV
jgi:hypothetical protein